MNGKLTTHVLDTAAGKPAAGIPVRLFRFQENERMPVTEMRTNADGRTDEPLLQGSGFLPGNYELVFRVAEYFPDGFYEEIPVKFRISETARHYHVPLLCSAWGYSTYRGS
ncbi:MAG: hydroxyisourate hydrolase [Luteolibacter sp.]